MAAAQLVAEPPHRKLLVERIAAQDRAHGLGAQLHSAAHHPLALGAVLVDEDVGDPVDVGEQERRTALLRAEQLRRVGEAIVQCLRPAVPEPRVADAVGAQQHRQRDAAAHEPAHVLGGVDGHDELVRAGVETQQSQHLVDVRLARGARLLAQLVVVDRRQLRHRGHEMIRQTPRDLVRGGQQCGRELPDRGRHAGHLGADRTPRAP